MYLSALKNKQRVIVFTQTIGLFGFLAINATLIFAQVDDPKMSHFNALLAVCGVALAVIAIAALNLYQRRLMKAPPGVVVNDFYVTLLTELSKTATVSASLMFFLENAVVYTDSLTKPLTEIPASCWMVTLFVVFATAAACKAIDVADKPDA